MSADEVVVAVPAAPAARLLADVAPAAAAELAGIESASMAVVTLAFRAEDVPDLAGFGLPGAPGGRPPHQGRHVLLRQVGLGPRGRRWRGAAAADLGRPAPRGGALQVADEELVAASLADLAEATGLTARPVDQHVQRWGGGLPQYAVGHLARVARIRTAVDAVPGLAVCGAAYEGVGVPAVVASARRAAAALLAGP